MSSIRDSKDANQVEIVTSALKTESRLQQSIWGGIVKKLQVPHGDKSISVLRNPDLDPVPAEERTWGFWSFFAFWGLPNFGAPSLSFGSAVLSLGLNIKQAIGALVISNTLIVLYTIANSNPGIKYHVGYTIDQRMIFGVYGSYFGVIIRVGLSVVQYASGAWLGGLYMNLIFSAFSKNYYYMKDTFPASVPMSRRDCIGFLCFQLIQMPLSWLKPRYTNIPAMAACCMSGLAMIGMLAYLININGGPGPYWYEKVTLSTSQTAWMWLYAMAIWYSGVSAAVVNQSDFSRFAKSEWTCYLGLFWGISIPGTFVPFAGMLYASTCKKLYGTAYWRPDEIVGQWFEIDYNAKARASSFFIGLAFTSCQIFMNMTQNGYPCGMDLAGIFPKYINITRGTLAMQLLSWVVQPWTFYNTSNQFLNATSSFGMFTTPIIAVNVIEFYWNRKQKLTLIDFYSTSKKGAYWYFYGFNWKPFLPVLASVALCIPGLFYSVNPQVRPNENIYNYYYGYMFFIPITSAGLYALILFIFPDKHERKNMTDPVDYFNCFSEWERERLSMLPCSETYIDGGDVFDVLDAEERNSFEVDSGEIKAPATKISIHGDEV
ncbi:hypothetical protein ZYGR_0AS02580 [Zygosaccharomyces rouxii]|uniref:Thiamine transporter n=1 Tax=Zygosaccharomyces rouxii TaxID=4956 RepID=A0A1Q3AH16_ZYGRO|nr:hypothetical protein ZYGR_0AS02580 [Zygosaccharomyces rouxii]